LGGDELGMRRSEGEWIGIGIGGGKGNGLRVFVEA